MKLSIYLQLKMFLIFLLFGIIAGGILGLFQIPKKLAYRHTLVCNIIDFLYVILFSFVFIYLMTTVNLGEFRFYLLISYLSGTTLERQTIGKIFAKGYKKGYNTLKVYAKKLSNSRIIQEIFK